MFKHERYDEADLAAIQSFAPHAGWRADANEAVFFARQLDFVKAKTYDLQLPVLTGLQMVPMDTSVPQWAENVIWRSYSPLGVAKIIANYADDLPRADVKGVENVGRIKNIGGSYGYNFFEMNASAQMTGTPLDVRRAAAARRANDEKLNSIALVGDSQFNLVGFLNHPNIGSTTLPNGNWAGADTTGEMILEDLLTMYNAIVLQSKNIHHPTDLGLPTAAHLAAYSKRVGTDVGQGFAPTAMQRFQQTIADQGYPALKVRNMPELATAGTGGVSIAVMGEYNENNISMPLPMAFTQLPPQWRNLEAVIDCVSRAGGVMVFYSLAFTQALGV